MRQKIKKAASVVALVLFGGILGLAFAEKIERSAFAKAIGQRLGIKPKTAPVQTAAGTDCVQQEEKDNSVMFVGCNGFF